MVIEMKSLNFKKKYKEMLKDGSKVATLRLGRKNYKENEMVKVIAGNEFVGIAKIVKVRYLTWDELKKEDAMLEGLKSKKELKKELKNIYGKFDGKEEFTQIVFEFVGDKNGGNKKV